MGWQTITKTVGLSASGLASLFAVLVALAPGCAGSVSSGTTSDTSTRSVAQPLGLGATATPLQLEVLTTSCIANGREDVFRVTNRGTAPVPLSDVALRYWADDTSGQSLVATVQSGGQITSLDPNVGCAHDVSGVTATATSFSPACGPDATHQADWEVAIADSDSTLLPPGAAWTNIRVDVALADGSNFVPGTAEWYSSCLSGTSYTSDVHFAVYDQGNLITANGVMTAPSCRPPPLGCLPERNYVIPVTGTECTTVNPAASIGGCTGLGCMCMAASSPVSGAVSVSFRYVSTGWTVWLSTPYLAGFGAATLVPTASGFSAEATLPPFFSTCGQRSMEVAGQGTFTVDCSTGMATFTGSCVDGRPTGCGFGFCPPFAADSVDIAGSNSLFAPLAVEGGSGPDAAGTDASAGGSACAIDGGVASVPLSSTFVPIVGLPGTPTAIATGSSHACALLADGSIACWGDNSGAQLGLGYGILSLSSTPVSVLGVAGATAIAAGGASTCALLPGGTVTCWGSGGGATSITPAPISALQGATAVSVSTTHACALLSNGTVACWGDNSYGELGEGTTTSTSTPVTVAGLGGAVAVAAGNGYTCALLSDGTAECWGRNDAGQLGIGGTPSVLSTPTPVATAATVLSGAKQLAASATGNFTCVSGGTIACWGANGSGELGNGTTTSSPAPVRVSGACGATSIATGLSHACALLADGTVACWGDNTSGELGNATTTSSSTPVAVSGLSGVRTIAAGGNFTCALLADATVACWGDNSKAAVGIGPPAEIAARPVDGGPADAGTCPGGSLQVATTPFFTTPVPERSLNGATALVAGYDGTCALTPGGSVQCSGYNAFGQLGDGTLVDRPAAVSVAGLGGATALGAGQAFSCAVFAGGAVSCWGYDADGELGDGTTNNSSVPVSVAGLTGVVAVSGGDRDACALLSNGSVECWGDNSRGSLGNGTTSASATPSAVSGLDRTTAIASGQGFHCARRSNGAVRCWGDNTYGELGTGATTGQLCAGGACWTTPMEVVEVRRAVAIATGFYDGCALLSNGTAECWGDNTYGELGNGTTTSSVTPVAVSDLRAATAIAAGAAFGCALLQDGTVRCWGDNTYGELGHGTTTSSTTSVAVSNLAGVTSIAAGAYRACARLSDSTVQCWGYLGDDGGPFPPLAPPPLPLQVPSSTTPLPVGGLSGIGSVAAGAGYTCALRTNGEVECLGSNASGLLGNGSALDSSAPVAVPTLEGVVDIAAGEVSACALLQDGTARCWGDNTYGELGNGTMVSSPTPVAVAGLRDAVAITVGKSYACALRKDGRVSCWGDNSFGELGIETTSGPNTSGNGSPCSMTPVPVSGLHGVKSLFAGNGSRVDTCALLGDGRVACWGDDTFGELGNGAQAGAETCSNGGACSTTPVLVPGLRDVEAIAAGGVFNCALLRSGSVECWGDDSQGELGDNTTNSTPRPTAVRGLSGVEQIAAGQLSACALFSNGRVACWGYNADGELGNGSTTSPSSLAPVTALSHVRAIFSGDLHACALLSGGIVDCWGDNSHGQLGYEP